MINIVLATDDNFVQHCCVTMTSILMNNKDVVFYLFTESLTAEHQSLLINQVEKYGGELNICTIDSEIVGKFPMPKNADDHISIATYYRLFVELVLPKNISRVLYLDCDMVVTSSLLPLFSIKMDDYAIGAVYQFRSPSQNADKSRLGIPYRYDYFNAGTLLINLDYWRSNNVTDRLFDFIKNDYAKIKQHDQDTLNAVLYSEALPIGDKWNYRERSVKIDIDMPAVIHFVSQPKPWDWGCKHPLQSYYYDYLNLTPFKNYRARFNRRKYYKHILRIKVLNFVCALDFLGIRKKIKKVNQ